MEKLKIEIEKTLVNDNVGEYKQKVRTLAKEARAKISLAEKEHMEKIMVQRLCSLKEYKEASVILCYFSSDLEVSTKKIMEKAWEDNKLIAIPKCNRSDCSMQFYAINSYQDIKINEYGFGEPYESKLIIGDEHSICIVPGLVFDYRGHRIGYGSGYYDRFLSCLSPDVPRILTAFDCQEAPRVVQEETDVRMHAAVTESGIQFFD